MLTYIVCICVAFLALEGWREWTSRDAAVHRAEQEMTNLARSLRQHADDTFRMAELAVANLAEHFEAEGLGDAALERARARALMDANLGADSRLRTIFVFGADGTLLVNSEDNVPLAARSSADRAYFRHHQAIDDHLPFLGPPVQSRFDGQWVVTLSRRINDDAGQFAGVVMATITAASFADYYKQFDVGAVGSITLASREGLVISRYPYDDTVIGTDLSTTTLFAGLMPTISHGPYRYTSPVDRVARIGGYDGSQRYGFMLMAARAEDQVLADWLGGAVQRAAATAAFIALLILLGWRLSEQRRRRYRSELALLTRDAEFRMLAEHSNDLVERFDVDGIRQYASPAALPLLGYHPEELIGRSAYDLIIPEDLPDVVELTNRVRAGETEQETVTCRLRRKDGRVIWVEAALRMLTGENGEPVGAILNTRDVTERKVAEQRLAAMATSDGLTGLQNRRAFDEALELEIERGRMSGAPLALLLIDVDRFKLFNDEYGHMAGDACLKAIAAVLAMAAKRSSDVAARYGGEELVLLLPETNLAGAAFVAGELCRQIQLLSIPHEHNAPWSVATVSIGVSSIENRPGDALRDATWLISTADMALYQAKADGRNRYRSAAPEVLTYARDAS